MSDKPQTDFWINGIPVGVDGFMGYPTPEAMFEAARKRAAAKTKDDGHAGMPKPPGTVDEKG